MNGKTILIIDDEIALCRMLTMAFEEIGATAVFATSGQQGLAKFTEHQPDLVLLDVLMPDIDGFQVCERLRRLADTPIIMLTSLRGNKDIVRGLDSGADDFISKPFSTRVLLARARAVIRRSRPPSGILAGDVYTDDYLQIDLPRRRIVVDGESIKLTATEFRLLAFLVRHAGSVVSYEQILEKVWGWEYRDSIDYVHVYLSHLRRKLEPEPRRPRYLVTAHGIGYSFERRGEAEATPAKES